MPKLKSKTLPKSRQQSTNSLPTSMVVWLEDLHLDADTLINLLEAQRDEGSDELAELVGNALTERTGFCHKGFDMMLDKYKTAIVCFNIAWDEEE